MVKVWLGVGNQNFLVMVGKRMQTVVSGFKIRCYVPPNTTQPPVATIATSVFASQRKKWLILSVQAKDQLEEDSSDGQTKT